MKLILGLVFAAALVIIILVINQINTRAADETAFEQLPATYQDIPVYPNAQNIWRGATQYRIMMWPVSHIVSFTTSDTEEEVKGFYKSTMGSVGWRYETSGIVSTCDNYFDGAFYVNSQDDRVWVVVDQPSATKTEYQIYKVAETFWGYGECP